jgi:hypothetical protein
MEDLNERRRVVSEGKPKVKKERKFGCGVQCSVM